MVVWTRGFFWWMFFHHAAHKVWWTCGKILSFLKESHNSINGTSLYENIYLILINLQKFYHNACQIVAIIQYFETYLSSTFLNNWSLKPFFSFFNPLDLFEKIHSILGTSEHSNKPRWSKAAKRANPTTSSLKLILAN